MIDVGSHFCSDGGQAKARPYGIHKLEFRCGGRQRGGSRPAFQDRSGGAFNVVEVQFGEKRDIKSDLLGSLSNSLVVIKGCFHVLVFDVSKPAAKDWHPESE